MPKILLVEDDADNALVLITRLEFRGYALVHALDGEHAVELARAEQPDLILMDIGLPKLNGHEATMAIKGDPRTAHIPVVMLTASVAEKDRELARATGADGFELKPVKLPKLLETMAKLLTGSPAE